MDTTKIVMLSASLIYFGILAYHLIKSKKLTTNLKSYTLSHERFPMFIIAVVMAVTMVGPADALALSQNGYKYGIIWAIFPIGAALAQFVSGKFFVGRINEKFSGLQTVGAIFESNCARSTSVAVGLVTVIQAIAFSGVLILAGGQVLETFLGIQKELGMIITCLFVGTYTSIGGMTAVMRTDKVQGFFMGTMMLALIIACIVVLIKGLHINNNLFIKPAFNSDYNLRIIFSMFLGYFLGELLLPAYCVRALISKDSYSASKGFLLASGVCYDVTP